MDRRSHAYGRDLFQRGARAADLRRRLHHTDIQRGRSKPLDKAAYPRRQPARNPKHQEQGAGKCLYVAGYAGVPARRQSADARLQAHDSQRMGAGRRLDIPDTRTRDNQGAAECPLAGNGFGRPGRGKRVRGPACGRTRGGLHYRAGVLLQRGLGGQAPARRRASKGYNGQVGHPKANHRP